MAQYGNIDMKRSHFFVACPFDGFPVLLLFPLSSKMTEKINCCAVDELSLLVPTSTCRFVGPGVAQSHNISRESIQLKIVNQKWHNFDGIIVAHSFCHVFIEREREKYGTWQM